MARTLGDQSVKDYGVIATPEVPRIPFGRIWEVGVDGSGLWNFQVVGVAWFVSALFYVTLSLLCFCAEGIQ